MPTQIILKVISSELEGYSDFLVSYLVKGFTFGFKVGSIGEPSFSKHRNYTSVFTLVIQGNLTKVMNLGRIPNQF